jgi:hypothetical protein
LGRERRPEREEWVSLLSCRVNLLARRGRTSVVKRHHRIGPRLLRCIPICLAIVVLGLPTAGAQAVKNPDTYLHAGPADFETLDYAFAEAPRQPHLSGEEEPARRFPGGRTGEVCGRNAQRFAAAA